MSKPDKVSGCGAAPACFKTGAEAEVRSGLVAYFEEAGRGLSLPPSMGSFPQTFLNDVMAPRLEAGRHRINARESRLGRHAGGSVAACIGKMLNR